MCHIMSHMANSARYKALAGLLWLRVPCTRAYVYSSPDNYRSAKYLPQRVLCVGVARHWPIPIFSTRPWVSKGSEELTRFVEAQVLRRRVSSESRKPLGSGRNRKFRRPNSPVPFCATLGANTTCACRTYAMDVPIARRRRI